MIHVVGSSIQQLLSFLDELTEQADQTKLGAFLRDMDITVEDVSEFVRFQEDRYARNLIRRGKYYEALLLCWRSGHRTPIHNHPGAVGGVCVLQGTATETLFEKSPCGLVKPTCSRDLETGGVVTLEDPYIHQVSNLQEAGQDLITLHVYSPPLPPMHTYSLTDSLIGEFRPTALEHDLGSGI